MMVRFGALIVSAVVLAALSAPSFAYDAKQKPKGHHVAAPVPAQSNWKGVREDFFAGPVQDPGSDNRYFTDTRQPLERNLGAPIFERWQ